jgi:hypothetical protein
VDIHPGAARRVFLDTDYLTQWDHHLHQRFPPAEKVALTGLEPGSTGEWDAGGAAAIGTVIKDDGRFRMWYYGLRLPAHHGEQPDLPLTCYAESDDGVHWRKPDLGLTGRHRYPGNNLLTLPGVPTSVVRALPGSAARYLACTVVYPIPLEPDVQDVPGNPDPRAGGNGTHIWASDDGLRWRHVTRVLAHGDNACLFTDELNQRYLLYHKVCGMHGLTSRRMWIGLESRDGKTWEGYQGVRRWRETFVCDDYDDLLAQARGGQHAEIYNVGVYRAGETLVSATTVMDTGLPLRERFAQNPAGLCHVRLGCSHDGFHWRYPKGRPAWLDRGAPGELDAGWLMVFSSLVDHDDDVLLYYGGSRYDHDWHMNPDFSLNRGVPLADHRGTIWGMMAKARRDRFASLAATYRSQFDVDAGYPLGRELYVNVQARHGEVRVALAQKSGDWHGALRQSDHLPGLAFTDCEPIAGDHVRARVRFRTEALAALPRDLPLTLRFDLYRAEVFSYEWA